MIKLLIVDDSALMRRLLADAFGQDEGFDLAFARDGEEALIALEAFRPDVITLDINMPGLNGLETLDRIMLQRPCPVVMVSAVTTEGAEVTLEALALGAVDFVAKPTGAVSLKIDDLAADLIPTVRAAATARVRRTHRLAERVRMRTRGQSRPATPAESRRTTPQPALGSDLPGLVIIGASTGGPPALDAVLGSLPEDFPWPVVVAQHMPASFTGSLARRLDGFCRLRVVEAAKAVRLEPGLVVVARGDADMMLSRRAGGIVALPAPQDERRRWHPSVDRLVESALDILPPNIIAGVLLTGMGNDGATAMTDLKARGGWTIAESDRTAVVWGMPGELAKAGGAVVVADLPDIGAHLSASVRAR